MFVWWPRLPHQNRRQGCSQSQWLRQPGRSLRPLVGRRSRLRVRQSRQSLEDALQPQILPPSVVHTRAFYTSINKGKEGRKEGRKVVALIIKRMSSTKTVRKHHPTDEDSRDSIPPSTGSGVCDAFTKAGRTVRADWVTQNTAIYLLFDLHYIDLTCAFCYIATLRNLRHRRRRQSVAASATQPIPEAAAT